MVTYVIKSLIHFKCHFRKDIITSFLLAFLEIKYNLSNTSTQKEKYFIFLWPSFRKIICRPWHLICVSDCVKFTSFSIIVETHVGVHLNWEIHNAGKNPGGEKSEKIEISIREEIENYSHDHVNKTVSLKKKQQLHECIRNMNVQINTDIIFTIWFIIYLHLLKVVCVELCKQFVRGVFVAHQDKQLLSLHIQLRPLIVDIQWFRSAGNQLPVPIR